MRVIVAGSRSVSDQATVSHAIEHSSFFVDELVCGMASGVDKLGLHWANQKGIRVRGFFANWKLYGRVAGFVRNEKMGEYADALIAIWDGQSRGTQHMIHFMETVLRKPVQVWHYPEDFQ